MVSWDEFRHLAAACWDKQQALRMCVSMWVLFCFACVRESETVFVYVCVCLHMYMCVCMVLFLLLKTTARNALNCLSPRSFWMGGPVCASCRWCAR